MAADLATVSKQVTHILNAATPGTYSAVIDTGYKDRHADAITESVLSGAMMIARAVCISADHPHRGVFISATPTVLTHGAELPDSAGPVGLVEIQKVAAGSWAVGVVRGVHHIEEYRANPSSIYDAIAHDQAGSTLGGYYAIAHNRIYFTGSSARAYVPLIARGTVTGIIPDEYEDTWIKLGVGLAVKEGDNLFPVAQYYYQAGLDDLKGITSMTLTRSVPVPLPIEVAEGDA